MPVIRDFKQDEMTIFLPALPGMAVYFAIALCAAHRSWKVFWTNVAVAFVALSGVGITHTNHNVPYDGLPQLLLAACSLHCLR
jgi:hypothetical protein